mmetsp:Transcript_1081/g.1691  ORF Transcript_1081/g.1691 Transcript_1081/m.1691 type:complete len:97 (+) Transcript_1081:68-358(+)
MSASSASNARRIRGSPSGLTPSQRQSRRFNDRIAGKTSACEILLICERYRAQFTPVHWVTALHRIAKASDGPEVVAGERFEHLLVDVLHLIEGGDR